MIDVDPRLRGALEQYKAAQAGKEFTLARINGRMDKLSSMPAPLNIAINLAQLVGFEYEYRPKDMKALEHSEWLVYRSERTLKERLAKIPGRYKINGVTYHPSDAKVYSNARPWEVHFGAQVGTELFFVGLRTDRFMVQKAKDGKAIVEVKGEEEPSLLHLPEGYSVKICTEPAWECVDDRQPCRGEIWTVSSLPKRARPFNPPAVTVPEAYVDFI
jgi:hypothetical protein